MHIGEWSSADVARTGQGPVMQEKGKIQKLLLTGQPGCGKTTIIMEIARRLEYRQIAGFYTQEIRSAGQRYGFSVQTFSRTRGTLSSVHIKNGPRVGRYRVDIHSIEQIVLPELDRPSDSVDVFVIDEIGKMECFSRRFVRAVSGILAGSIPLVATVALKGAGFIAEAKAHPDVELIKVTAANRDSLPAAIVARLFGHR